MLINKCITWAAWDVTNIPLKLQAKKYTDVTVCCHDDKYDCHRLVLAGNSEYFYRLFEHADCPKPVIVLHEVQGRIFEVLLEYMYTGQSKVASSDMKEVLRQAQCLKIR